MILVYYDRGVQMRICPNCQKEVPDHDWYCPYCHNRLPSLKKGTGHASMGDLDSYNQKVLVSVEDKNMIRDKNHMSSSNDDEDYDCAQPYDFVTRENGDRN